MTEDHSCPPWKTLAGAIARVTVVAFGAGLVLGFLMAFIRFLALRL